MTPPAWFISALATLDPLLRVRFSSQLQEWSVERKAHVPEVELWYLSHRSVRLQRFASQQTDERGRGKMEKLAREVGNEFDAARSGYRVVVTTPTLTSATFGMLVKSDVRNYGGFSRFVDEYEKRQEGERAAAAREAEAKRNQLHEATFDLLSFLNRRRITDLQFNPSRVRDVVREEAKRLGVSR